METINLYPYKVRECKSREELQTALDYYSAQLLANDLTQVHRNNMLVISGKLMQKIAEIDNPGATPVLPIGIQYFSNLQPAEVSRKDAFVELQQLVPRFFQHKDPGRRQQDDWAFVIRMFELWLGVLKLNGMAWRSYMYTELVKFTNCGTTDEMITYLLHELVTSGLHHPKQVKKQINLTIRLVYHLRLENLLPIRFPSQVLRNLSMAQAGKRGSSHDNDGDTGEFSEFDFKEFSY